MDNEQLTKDEQQDIMKELANIKNCSVCGATFECNAADIANCQCYAVKVPEDIAAIISKRYADCLCAQCLQEIIQKETQQKGQDNL
jgi:ribosomal protein L34E